jgi:ribonuclease I
MNKKILEINMGSVSVIVLTSILALFFLPTPTHHLSLPPTSTDGKRPPKASPPPPSPPPYDYFKLALSWPHVFCMVNTCPNPPPMYLVIHGLWPSSSTLPSDPTNCDEKEKNKRISKNQWEVS